MTAVDMCCQRFEQPQGFAVLNRDYLNPEQTFLYLPSTDGATRVNTQGLTLHTADAAFYTDQAPKTSDKKLTIVFAGGQTAACGTGNLRYFEIGGYSVGGGIGIEQVSGQESVTGWTGTWNTVGDCNFLDSDVGVDHYYVAVLNDSSLKLFRDGIKIFDGSITWSAPNTGKIALGASTWQSGTSERCSNFQYSLFAADFGNAITDDIALELSSNPWQIFAADDVSLFFDYVSIGGTDGSASGDISGVTISSPAGSAAGDALASSGLSSVSLSSPTAAASGGALAATSPASVTLTAPTGTASATAGGDATATASIQSITLSYPTGTASGTATASASVAAVSIIAPTGSASVASGDATAEGEIQAVTLTAPTGYVPQETSIAGGDDRPRGIYWQNQPKRKIKRSKLDQILDTMGVEDVAEDFQEFVEQHAEKKTINQVIRKHVTPDKEIKWPSLENDIAAIKKLLAEYEQYLIDQDDDDILPFLMELI